MASIMTYMVFSRVRTLKWTKFWNDILKFPPLSSFYKLWSSTDSYHVKISMKVTNEILAFSLLTPDGLSWITRVRVYSTFIANIFISWVKLIQLSSRWLYVFIPSGVRTIYKDKLSKLNKSSREYGGIVCTSQPVSSSMKYQVHIKSYDIKQWLLRVKLILYCAIIKFLLRSVALWWLRSSSAWFTSWSCKLHEC